MPHAPVLRSRWLLLALCLALVASLQTMTGATANTAVDGKNQAYTAGAAGTPSTEVAYDGEPLTVQASYVGRQAAEPTVGVDADGTAFFAAGTFDGPGIVVPQTYVMKSADGGNTWEKTSPELPTGNASPPITLDPYVYTDDITGRVFNPELYAGCTYMNFSDDQGESWTPNPVACGSFVNDHQTIATGPVPAALEPQATYPSALYYCFNRVADASCSRSLDGGLTFQPTVNPAFLGFDPANGGLCGGLHGHIDVGPEGNLYLPKGHCNNPWLATSTDGGTTWTRTKVDATTGAAGTHLAVETDDAGNVYFLWWGRQDRLPYLAVSRDQGRTFSEPMMIAPPGVAEVNFPILTAGEEGRVAIAFPGTEDGNRGNKARPWNHYMVVTADALADQPLFLSTTANPITDPVLRGNCGPGRCGPLWDFQDIQVSAAGGEFWAAVADGCVGGCVTDGSPNTQTVGEGVAVRQLTGPLLRPGDGAPDDGTDPGDGTGPGDEPTKGNGKGKSGDRPTAPGKNKPRR